MQKITALAAFLCKSLKIRKNKVKTFLSDGDLTHWGPDLGLVYDKDGTARRQISLGYIKYDAIFQVDDFPGDGRTFLALVCAWLADNDPEREHDGLARPSVDVEMNDAKTCDLELQVEFLDHLVVHENPNGNIDFDGLKWSLAELDIEPTKTVKSLEAKIGHND